jgi:DNA-binding MarR family transcriptional regulator
MGIKEQIQQQKPFKSEYHKAHINVLYTASWIGQYAAQTLKPFKISWQQFNILRILKGKHPEPATIKELSERMIDKASNASRLVDKLRLKGLVDRTYCAEDRRRVHITLTNAGMTLLIEASKQMEHKLQNMMEEISEEEAFELNRILDKMRDD